MMRFGEGDGRVVFSYFLWSSAMGEFDFFADAAVIVSMRDLSCVRVGLRGYGYMV